MWKPKPRRVQHGRKTGMVDIPVISAARYQPQVRLGPPPSAQVHDPRHCRSPSWRASAPRWSIPSDRRPGHPLRENSQAGNAGRPANHEDHEAGDFWRKDPAQAIGIGATAASNRPANSVIPNTSGSPPARAASSEGAKYVAVNVLGHMYPDPTGPSRNACRNVPKASTTIATAKRLEVTDVEALAALKITMG